MPSRFCSHQARTSDLIKIFLRIDKKIGLGKFSRAMYRLIVVRETPSHKAHWLIVTVSGISSKLLDLLKTPEPTRIPLNALVNLFLFLAILLVPIWDLELNFLFVLFQVVLLGFLSSYFAKSRTRRTGRTRCTRCTGKRTFFRIPPRACRLPGVILPGGVRFLFCVCSSL